MSSKKPSPANARQLKLVQPKSVSKKTLELACKTLRLEADAVAELSTRLDDKFLNAVSLIASLKGKLVVSGMGKSGIIAQKIAATLTSTGTAAVFMHPSEAAHGDLGVVQSGDAVLALSKSGATEELTFILPALKSLGVPIIAMVGNLRSALALHADITLDVSVKKEADKFDLAPTASTTAMLALGDALAVALMDVKNFTPTDFAQNHPSGALGKRLTMRVADIMATGDKLPLVRETDSLTTVILEMTAKRFGVALVVSRAGNLTGIFTDGDLRRLVLSGKEFSRLLAKDVMTKAPKFVAPALLAKACLEQMETYRITQLPVCDNAGKPIGIVHLHDLISMGL